MIRTAAWSVVAAHGFKYKRVIQVVIGGAGTANSAIFACLNSGVSVPQWMVDVAISSGVPIVVGIVGVVVLNSRHRDASRWDW